MVDRAEFRVYENMLLRNLRGVVAVPFGYSAMEAAVNGATATFTQRGLLGTRTDCLRWLLWRPARDLLTFAGMGEWPSRRW